MGFLREMEKAEAIEGVRQVRFRWFFEIFVGSYQIFVGSCELFVGLYQIFVGSCEMFVGLYQMFVSSCEIFVGSI